MNYFDKKNAFRILVIGGLVSLLTACGQSPVRNPFATHAEPKLGDLPALSYEEDEKPKVLWSAKALGKQTRFSKLLPYVQGDSVYLADNKGQVVALNRANGKKIWKQNTKHSFTAGPKVIDDLVVLATQDAKVVALDAKTGEKRWLSKVSSEVLSAPNGAQGIILVHAMDGTISGLNAQDGHKIWQFQQSTPSLTLHYASSPAIVNDVAMVGLSNGKLLAINLQNGQLKWERTIAIPKGRSELQRMVDISADPIVVGNVIYAITYKGKLAAVDIENGDLLWERDLSSYQNIAQADNYLFVTDINHQLWALDRRTGSTLWKQNALADRFISGPAIIDDVVAVNDRGGYTHFLSMDKGLIINRYHLWGKFYQGPIAMGNTLLINTNKGKIVAIHYESEQNSA